MRSTEKFLRLLQVGDLQDVLAGRSGRTGAAPYLVEARRAEFIEEVLLDIDDGDESFTLFVKVEHVVRATGAHAYFRCPNCGAPRTAIVLKEMEVECIDCFFKYDDALSTTEKQRLIQAERAQTRALPRRRAKPQYDTDGRPRPVRARPGEGIGRPRANLQVVKRDRTIRAALETSKPAGMYDPVIDYLAQPVSHWEAAELSILYQRPGRPALLKDHAALDIRAMYAASSFADDDGIRARFLGWSSEITGVRRLLWVLDGRGTSPMVFIAHHPDVPGDFAWQRIRTVRQRNNRPSFVCPVTGRAADVLYLRNGLFASRRAQRLVYASQRAPWTD